MTHHSLRGRRSRACALGLVATTIAVALVGHAAQAQQSSEPRRPRGSASSARKARPAPGQGNGGGAAGQVAHVADIRAFGARPDDPGFDNAVAIQRAHDSLLDEAGRSGGINASRGVVLVPSGKWTVHSPVWFDGDNIELHGVGSTSIISSGPISCPPIILGKKRLELWRPNDQGGHFGAMPRVFTTDHRVDLFGRLDAKACPEPGKLFGLRTRSPGHAPAGRADHYIMFWGIPPCFGSYDQWASTQKLMIQVCFENPRGPVGTGPIMGIGAKEDFGGPWPWILQAGDTLFNDSKFHFKFRTKEGGGQVRDISFGDLSARGVQRLALQIDFSTDGPDGLCNVQAYLNGRQVPITRGLGTRLAKATADEPSFTAADGLHFAANETNNFTWGAAGPTPHPHYGINDLNLYGLRIGNAPLYKDVGPGSPETRLDGRPVNDMVRYLDPTTDHASTICYLPMTDRPHEPTRVTDRLVRVHHGGAARGGFSYAMFHADSVGEIYGGGQVQYTRLRNLRLETENQCGVALALGAAFYCGLFDCEFAGGWWGVASTGEVSYDYKFRNNMMYGRDAAFYGCSMIIDADGLARVSVGRTMLRLTGCSVRWSNIRTADVEGTEAFIKITGDSSYGSQYWFDGLDIDNEGKPLPTLAAIYCERHNSILTTLDVRNVNPGTVPPGVPMIKLVDRFPVDQPGGAGPAKLTVQNLYTQQVGIQTDGPGWEGSVADVFPCDAWRLHSGKDGKSNVVVRQRLDDLPSYGAWQANAHIIEIRHPEPGEPQAYICSGSGVGSWRPGDRYAPGAFTFRDGTVYLAKAQNKDSRPPSAHWAAVSEWDGSGEHPAGSYAVADGKLWVALPGGGRGRPSPRNDRWVMLAPARAARFSPITTVGKPGP